MESTPRTPAQQDQPPAPQGQTGDPRQSLPPDGDNAEDPGDDAPCRHVIERLSEHLDIGVGLAAVCERLAALPKKGRIEAVYAAARLTQANAQLAKAIAAVLQVDRRQRTIVEQIQSPAPEFRHSNSSEQSLLVDGLTTKMLRYLHLVAGETLDPALKEAEQDAGAKANLAPAAFAVP